MSRLTRPGTTRAGAACRTLSVLCLLALALGGCSNGRISAPSLTTTAHPSRFETLRYPAAGVSLQVPVNWSVSAEKSPLVAVVSSGPATIALWRYGVHGPALTATAQLTAALRSLEQAAHVRDPSIQIQRTGLSTLDGAGAVIIDATERINGKLRRVRSEHVYLNGGELVLEAYAPPEQFPSDDHLVFSPVRKSLRLLSGGQPVATTATSTSLTPPAGPTTLTTPAASTTVGGASTTVGGP